MSLKRNITANYASQIYVTLISIVMVPMYIKFMGVEAYGLVGFYAMLQAWFFLLDMGLTPTVARETARHKGGRLNATHYRHLVRALEGVFLMVAVLGGMVLFSAATWFGARWTKAEDLPVREIVVSLQMIAGIVVLRWMAGLYRGIITGAEQFLLLSMFNSTAATLRFVVILPVLIYVSASPLAFFGFQLAVAVLELSSLAWIVHGNLPSLPKGNRVGWNWSVLKPILGFSLSVSFTSSAWVMVTQSDKLVLSKILPLADYGYFSVAVIVANGIMVMTSPVTSAALPRMARLLAEGRHDQIEYLYKKVTQTITVIVVPLAIVLAFFPNEALWAWTGDSSLVAKTSPVLRLYAVGYGVLTVSSLPYILQYSYGNLRLHLFGSALFVTLLIPALLFGTRNFGAVGAGWAWLTTNLLYFSFWVPLVHRRFAPGIHIQWIAKYVAPSTIVVVSCAGLIAETIPRAESRLFLVAQLVGTCVVLVLAAYFTNKVLSNWRKRENV